ncbi:uncharacterized protein [Canis lupus baileyi]|uniref:Wilms tumor protein 1-interacting protein-like n=1 Tax=Canis lupus familiaris TaxID=9615 RepID=UPI0015F16609|nr:Wilms tumor protein 1-interacting protein-like [Canis lupus familiaris]XP_038533102.1 Wilms tumor protein 1-interacting protein-like [Canis lupus familiaris]XP_038538762.1 Wilms tumor protein 1-interacting protein-like [Canis lupus familiaris]
MWRVTWRWDARRYDAAGARGDGVRGSPGEASGSGTGERRGSQATPDALTSPGRQNVRPGPRRAEAAVVTCGGPVTQSRGAGTRRAEPAGGGRPQGPGAAAGRHLPSRLQVRECGARSRRSAASLLPPPPAPAPRRDTQYSPEAEAAPRGSCQWEPGCRPAAAGRSSGPRGRRRRRGARAPSRSRCRPRRRPVTWPTCGAQLARHFRLGDHSQEEVHFKGL